MANETNTPGNKALKVLAAGQEVERAAVAADGTVTIRHGQAQLQSVDVADVDLLLSFSDGSYTIIPNGALDALGGTPHSVIFNDGRGSLGDLFKLVGIINPAKAGSLRLVSENIDAAPPPEEQSVPVSEPPLVDSPPAPMVKVGVGTSAGSGKGPGNGAGAGEGEVPATVTPLQPAAPPVYRVGHSTQTIADILNATGLGQPNVSADLYTSSAFKLAPSGRADLPLGAYDAGATPDQLALRASAAGQSTHEVINGTAGADSIDFNPAFSNDVGQWSKTLHITLNNFSDVTSIQLVFNANIAGIAGFDVLGTGVTRDGASSNSWHVAFDAAMLLNGLDVALVYNVNNGVSAVDFGADIIVDGHAGLIAFQVIDNLSFTWRDADTQADFVVTSSTGDPLMVLPKGGVGVEVFAGNGDDVVNAGAGNDLVHGGAGNDTLSGGRGNDVLDGGLGADKLLGGEGIDTAAYESATAGLTATLDTTLGVANTGEALGDIYFDSENSNVENLTGSAFDDILIGDSLNNVLLGGSGNDKLIGGVGADTLNGGLGTDAASYEYATGAITVSLTTNAGTQGQASGDVLVSIENLIGGAGNDTFTGAAGNQANSFDGRGGNDTVSYAPSTDGVAASLTTGLAGVVQTFDAAGDTYANIENLTGSFYADTLIGDNSINILNGGRGNNVLEGLGGGDSFVGGIDTDTVSYAHSASGVVSSLTTVFAAGPAVTQTNDALGDTYTSIENMVGSDSADTLIGSSTDNVINGGLGGDTLEGMGGSDTLIGSVSGNDTASYAHATSFVRASLTTGLSGFVAEGQAGGDTYTSIENLTGSDYADTLIGDSGINTLTGGSGDDVLEGLGGGDALVGGTGSNTASYEHAANDGFGLGVTASLTTPAANTADALGDTYSNIQNLTGSAFTDTLTGDANNNILTGGDGNDTLSGLAGTDMLYGGNGNDSLTDDGIGVATLDAGAGDDLVTITGSDGNWDSYIGGAGVDTFVWSGAGTRMDINLENGGNFSGVYGAITSRASGTGFENVTATGSNQLYVYASNTSNIIIGGSTANDSVDYRYATSGISASLVTGVVTGGSGNDTLSGIDHLYYGSNYNDILIGNTGNNSLQGGAGADYIDGGAGFDYARYDYWDNNGAANVSLLSAGVNSALGFVFTNWAAGDTLVNIEGLVGSGYGETLVGNEVDNTIYANGGDDILQGLAGADYLDGGGGSNTVSFSLSGLATVGSATTGVGAGVTATLTTGLAGINNSGDAASDTYVSIQNLTGSDFSDTLVGSSVANILDGGAGNDLLEGLAGGDTFRGSSGNDTVTYAHSTLGVTVDLSNGGVVVPTNDAVNDQFISIENLTGSALNDTLVGNAQDNVLIGGGGNDALDGGAGFDTASYVDAAAYVTINLAAGTVVGSATSNVGSDSLTSIERVIGTIYGDAITGSGDDDIIDGGAGADTINGGAGVNTISYATATSKRDVDLSTGVNTDGDVLSNIQNIIGSAFGEILTGDGGDNVIEGGVGNDTLDGGAHAAAGDTASYAGASGAVVASLIAGTATGAAGSDTLANFENLLGSAYNDTLTGNAGANALTGGTGDDLLTGGDGADTLTGGSGVDTVSYSDATAGVTVTINGTGTVGFAAGDVLHGIENLIGSAYADRLTGDGLANVIDGGLGNDTINGGGGGDTISYASAGAAVTVDLGNGTATGGGGSDSLSNFANIIGSAYADTLIGDGSANLIEGGLGGDSMDGGPVGGPVDDPATTTNNNTATYSHSTAAVTVSLLSGASNSGGDAAGDTFVRASGYSTVENLIGSSYDDTLTGDAGANVLDGGDGNDLLLGGLGADALIGGNGLDTVSYAGSAAVTVNLTSSAYRGVNQGVVYSGKGGAGDASGDTYSSIENVIGSSNNDVLMGSTDSNTMTGGTGDDLVYGDAGNDVVYANQGKDTAYGEAGDDTFYVSALVANQPTLVDGGADSSLNNGGGDTLVLQGLTSGSYSLSALAGVTNTMEILNIRGDSANTALNVTSADIRAFVDGGNASRLVIKADSGGDSLVINTIAGETVQTVAVGTGATDYLVFNAGVQVAQIHWQAA